ncbi:MAG TPA: hypothetical protein VM074_09905 [Solimonas sp.]|nr:hypothetical protein [Solimonas sp.]
MKTLRAMLALLVMVPFAVLAGRAHELVDPDPIEVPGKLAVSKVESIIKESLAARDWVIKDVKGHDIVAQYERSGRGGMQHKAKIGIHYDATQVTIKYIDSRDLDYSDEGGSRRIHGNYNKWIANLVKDISVKMSAAAF